MQLKENSCDGKIEHPTDLEIRKENGYFVFSFDAKNSLLFSSGEKYNDPIYDGSVVEVFIYYGKKNHYYEVEVAPNGALFLANIKNIHGKFTTNCLKRCFVKTDIGIEKDSYKVNIYFPINKIKTERPLFNAFRIETINNKQYLYALNPTMCGSFHVFESFIDLLSLL